VRPPAAGCGTSAWATETAAAGAAAAIVSVRASAAWALATTVAICRCVRRRFAASDADLQAERRLRGAQRPRLLLERRELRVGAGEPAVERVQAEHGGARPRGDRRVLRAQRRDPVRRARAADRGRGHDGEGDRGERQKPTPRRVCLPKHEGGPYHSAGGGVLLLVEKDTSFGTGFSQVFR
jgi:hypothetical protein